MRSYIAAGLLGWLAIIVPLFFTVAWFFPPSPYTGSLELYGQVVSADGQPAYKVQVDYRGTYNRTPFDVLGMGIRIDEGSVTTDENGYFFVQIDKTHVEDVTLALSSQSNQAYHKIYIVKPASSLWAALFSHQSVGLPDAPEVFMYELAGKEKTSLERETGGVLVGDILYGGENFNGPIFNRRELHVQNRGVKIR